MKIAKNIALAFLLSVTLLASCQYDDNYDDNTLETTLGMANQIIDVAPALTSDYSEACRAYREFLLGQRRDESGGSLYYEYLSHGPENSEFTLADINFDGIPELHFRANHYCIFSYHNGQVTFVKGFSRYVKLLNNLAIYTDFWDRDHTTEADRTYVEFGEDFQERFSFYSGHSDGTGVYLIGYNGEKPVHVSKTEFEVITSPIFSYCTDPKNSDMIPWTNYYEWLAKNKDEYVPMEEDEWPGYDEDGNPYTGEQLRGSLQVLVVINI